MANVVEERSPFHSFEIYNSLSGKTEITVDGVIVSGVRSISFDQSYDTIPNVSLELIPSQLNVDVLAKLEVALDITDVREAINCLQLEMKLSNEFRDAVIASAESALTEHDISKDSITEIAAAVVERIFEGEYL